MERPGVRRPLQPHDRQPRGATRRPDAGQKAGEYPGNEGFEEKTRVISMTGLSFTRERSKVRSLVRPPRLMSRVPNLHPIILCQSDCRIGADDPSEACRS